MITVAYCPACYGVSCDCTIADKAYVKFTNLCPHPINIRLKCGDVLEIPQEVELRAGSDVIDLALPLPVEGVAIRRHAPSWPPELFNHFYIASLDLAKLAWEEGRNDFATVHKVLISNGRKVAEKLSFSPTLIFGRLFA